MSFRKAAARDPDFYAVEAAGLRWLAAAGGVRVVEVLDVGPDGITLEELVAGRPSRRAAADFGAALARTHAAGAAAFGAPPAGWTGDGYIGRQPMTLRPAERWGGFYADQRVLPYARAARRLGQLSEAGLRAVERVAERLHAGDFDDGRPPSRIHGDLWSGNVFWTTDDQVALIDPAAHGGDGLTDLAMLALFGTPHLDTVLDAYAATAPLPDDWRALIGLHQLHPLLVHAVSHGAAYGAEAEQTARRYR